MQPSMTFAQTVAGARFHFRIDSENAILNCRPSPVGISSGTSNSPTATSSSSAVLEGGSFSGHSINHAIIKIEQDGSAISDVAMEDMKKKRLKIKDDIYQMLIAS